MHRVPFSWPSLNIIQLYQTQSREAGRVGRRKRDSLADDQPPGNSTEPRPTPKGCRHAQ